MSQPSLEVPIKSDDKAANEHLVEIHPHSDGVAIRFDGQIIATVGYEDYGEGANRLEFWLYSEDMPEAMTIRQE